LIPNSHPLKERKIKTEKLKIKQKEENNNDKKNDSVRSIKGFVKLPQFKAVREVSDEE